jgi:hypothetical protein
MAAFLTGCFQLKKDASSVDKFISVAEDNRDTGGPIIESENESETVIEVYGKSWNVSFYKYAEPEDAKKTFEEKSKGFKEVAPEKMEKNIEKGNYCKRYFEDKNRYIYVSYIEDSVLYIEGLPEDKEEIEAFVSTLKY